MKNLETICVIDASGTFLTEHITTELWEGDESKLLEFIDDHKWEPVEDYEAKDVLEMIVDLADSQKRFLEQSMKAWLREILYEDDLHALQDGTVADIWYDAQSNDDSVSAQLISDTQNAMDTVAKTLLPFFCEEVK